jgi:hypothetical protein
MKHLLTAAFSLFFINIHAQSYPAKDAATHIGDSVTICGKIYSAKYLQYGDKHPTFLNMGAAYPNKLMTIVIWEESRTNFNYKPEDYLLDKNICVSGKIEKYNGKPEMIISSPESITIKDSSNN